MTRHSRRFSPRAPRRPANPLPRVLRALLPLVMLVVMASGCGGDADHPSDGKTVIRVAHWWGDSQKEWQAAIAEFERTHPNIRVEQQVLSFNVHVQKVLTSAAADAEVGDLILLEDWFAQELLNRDYLVDLKPFIDRDLKPEEYFPISLETYRNGQAIRAFPVALGSYPLYYNKDLFDAAGVSYPDSTWTYDTLLAAAQKLTKDTDGDGKPDQWGFLLDNSGGFDGLIYSMGGAVLTPDLKHSAFAQPATVNALNFWVDLVRKYHVAPQNASILGGSSSGGSLRPFETGRFAMGMLGSFLGFYRDAKFRWDIALPPKGAAGRKYLRFGAAFGIPKSSKHAEAAWEFLRWMVKEMPPEQAGLLFAGLVPNSRRLAGSAAYLDAAPKVNRRVVIDMIENHSFSYWRTKWLQFRDQGFQPEVDLMVAGEKSVPQGAADASKRIDEVLNGE